MLLEGIFLPLTTPFYPDGRVYLRKLAANVEHYSRTPAAGLLVLGAVGEARNLTDEETVSVLEEAIRSAAKEKVMLASVGRESVFATLKLAKVAEAAGYDALAVEGPSFAPEEGMRLELLTYFRAVADGAGLPVVLVSRGLSLEVIGELAGHPNVIGIIDEEAELERIAGLKAMTAAVSREATVTTVFAAATRRMLTASLAPVSSLGGVAVLEGRPGLKTRVKKVGFQVLVGSTEGMLPAWRAGASGAVPRLGACAPQACFEVWQAFKDEDPPLAEEKQERVRAVAARLEGLAGIGAIKYGCDFNGYFGGLPRLPLLGLTAGQRAELEQELAAMRN